jgi:pyruvate ferredoxin oxidoreductase alpha subunit
MIIQAYKIAEHKDVLTPMMVNLDGFILTHTYELVDIPEQKMVDEFLPAFETPNKMSFEEPKNLGFSSKPDDNTEFKYQQNEAMFNAIDVIRDVDQEFGEKFGRKYHDMVEEYRCEDAEVVLVALGSVCGTIRVVVDKMRAEGKKVGLLKIRYMRPFPEAEIKDLARRVNAIGVIDKDISFGYEGTVYTNVNSAISKIDKYVYKSNFVGGLGGRDITKDEIEEMFNKLFSGVENKSEEKVEFFSLNVETND